jgi:hypothetical protein
MTRTRYTVLFAVIGAALLTWWSKRDAREPNATVGRGEVIFGNTPLPSEPDEHSGPGNHMKGTDTLVTTPADQQGKREADHHVEAAANHQDQPRDSDTGG